MGLFNKIFPKKAEETEQKTIEYFTMLTGYTPVFTSFEGGLYESALCRTAINSIATHCAKLLPEISGSGNPVLAKAIKYKPNAYMSTYQPLS